ncbi:MAG: peptide ABC transporter substrate-binding protein, partial [Chloroflexota bacterium]|nr:peptide ABC transporter substrate-binding protein [Chloroflexota bacterium]
MSRENKIWIIVIAVVVAGLLFSCLGGFGYLWYQSRGRFRVEPGAPAPTATPRPAAKGAELNLPGADPPTLDPALAQDATSAEYIVEIFSGLVTINPDLEIAPDIAESWEVGEDGKVYTFHLGEDAKFHDGMPVTAHDFKYSIERACDPRIASPVADAYLRDIVGAKDKLRGVAAEVSGVRVIDDHTLEIEIDAPKVYFLYNLTYPVAFVVDERNVERGGRTWTDRPNGTGPFKLAEYRLGEKIVLERNEFYYGDPKPALERVNYILAGGSAMTMYETGELDAVPVGLVDIERVTDPANPLHKELTIVQTLSTYYLGFNVQEPPFDDVKVRQALNMAIDKQKIV